MRFNKSWVSLLTLSGVLLLTSVLSDFAHGDENSKGEVRPSRSVPGVTKASQDLTKLQRKIRQAQSQFSKDRRFATDRANQIRGEVKAVQRTIKALQERLEKRKAEIEKKKAALDEKKKTIEERDSREESLKGILSNFLGSVEELVDSSIPWKKSDRKRQITQVKKVLTDKLTIASSALGAVGRVHQEEEALGRLVETSVLKINGPDGETEVRGFHLGLMAVIFANEDGSILGYARSGQQLEDGLGSLTEGDLAQRGYLVAVDILRRRRTPAIVELLLPSLPVKGAEE